MNKYLSLMAALPLAFGTGAVLAQDVGEGLYEEEEGVFQEEGIFEENEGFIGDEEDEVGFENDEAFTSPGLENDTFGMFETNNWGYDDYGYYDEDFVWETDDEWFNDWSEVGTEAWDEVETANWGVFGYDDAGEWGIWDW